MDITSEQRVYIGEYHWLKSFIKQATSISEIERVMARIQDVECDFLKTNPNVRVVEEWRAGVDR
jgi:hypothetical protein